MKWKSIVPALDDLVIDRDTGTYTFTHSGKHVRYPSVTAVLGRIDGEQWATEEDRILGRLVHQATALLDGAGDGSGLHWPSVSTAVRGRVEAWASFKDKTGFRPVVVEQPVACHEHRYCGTPDAAGEFDRMKVSGIQQAVIDKKPWAKKWTHALQLSAYKHALLRAGLPFGGARLLSVHLRNDGSYRIEEWPDAFQDFLDCLRFHNMLLRRKGETR